MYVSIKIEVSKLYNVQQLSPTDHYKHLHYSYPSVIWSCTCVTPGSMTPNNDQHTTEDTSAIDEVIIIRTNTLYRLA